MDPITGLVAVVSALPMLYIVQASIDAALERRERARERKERGKRSKRARILIKRSIRRAAVATIRKMEREMARETRGMASETFPSLPIQVRPSSKRSGA